ncbi:sugar phosphate isomerase/epimerase, partial [bacterium]|nr:sugar phosphate isomerase/epimerase [bacterium]
LGLTVAIEPLRRQECNIINSAAEGLTLARAVNTAQIKLLIDFYHLKAEGESCQIIKEACDQICHVHLAKPDGRGFPALADLAIYQEFFDSLAAVEYQERISIEAYSQDYRNDAANSLSFLRNFIHDEKRVLES